MRTIIVLVGFAALGIASAVPQDPAAEAGRRRFVGFVAGTSGEPTHLIVLASDQRFNGLVFRDFQRPHTRYRVCWNHKGNRARCWTRTTGARGAVSVVRPRTPHLLGDWFARWYVNGRRVASWHVVFAIA
jgi:hypothetical protein